MTFSDFSANDPYHLELEKLSREIWAPNPDVRGKATSHWYYERARGQYADDRARQATPTKRRVWEQQHPPRQRLTKTLVAKYEMTWQQQPHRVSEGSEKNFAHFSVWVQDNRPQVDARYFEHLIAKAILFQECDRIVARLNQGGYKANVVTYTVAWLSYLTGQRLNLGGIWQRQRVTDELRDALEALAKEVWDHLTSPPPSVLNVSEWSKKLACWESLRQRWVSLPGLAEEVHTDGHIGSGNGATPDARNVAAVPADVWTALARWGDETGKVAYWERGLALSLADRVRTGRPATPKQAKHGLRILREARTAGFYSEA